jgi:hypothetical protein
MPAPIYTRGRNLWFYASDLSHLLVFCRYEVRPKKKSLVDDIDKFVRENHPYECGIIYCLSRTDCEKIAGKLTVRPSLRTPNFELLSTLSRNNLVAARFESGRFILLTLLIKSGQFDTAAGMCLRERFLS